MYQYVTVSQLPINFLEDMDLFAYIGLYLNLWHYYLCFSQCFITRMRYHDHTNSYLSIYLFVACLQFRCYSIITMMVSMVKGRCAVEVVVFYTKIQRQQETRIRLAWPSKASKPHPTALVTYFIKYGHTYNFTFINLIILYNH